MKKLKKKLQRQSLNKGSEKIMLKEILKIGYVVADEAISFAAESIIPLCLGGEFPQYLVTGLKGTITANSIDLSLKFGEFQTSFRGFIVK